jgi:hypothetical protein
MTAGGARVRSGPPRDPQALRRERDASEWHRFPSQRRGDPPPWPLPRPTQRERLLWSEEWARGVANAWEMFGLERQVAMYVRTLVAVERKVTNATLLGKLLSQEDRLGLTPAGLARNLWIIGAALEAPAATAPELPVRRGVRRGSKEKARMNGLGVLDGGA